MLGDKFSALKIPKIRKKTCDIALVEVCEEVYRANAKNLCKLYFIILWEGAKAHRLGCAIENKEEVERSAQEIRDFLKDLRKDARENA